MSAGSVAALADDDWHTEKLRSFGGVPEDFGSEGGLRAHVTAANIMKLPFLIIIQGLSRRAMRIYGHERLDVSIA